MVFSDRTWFSYEPANQYRRVWRQLQFAHVDLVLQIFVCVLHNVYLGKAGFLVEEHVADQKSVLTLDDHWASDIFYFSYQIHGNMRAIRGGDQYVVQRFNRIAQLSFVTYLSPDSAPDLPPWW